jgi:hypothetical protein
MKGGVVSSTRYTILASTPRSDGGRRKAGGFRRQLLLMNTKMVKPIPIFSLGMHLEECDIKFH